MADFEIKDEQLQGLKDKVILVTGGSSGIGLATVLLCTELGAKVVAGDLNPLPAEAEGKNILYVPLDVTSWASQSAFFKKAVEQHGKIDHVFANAGIGPRANYVEDDVDENGDLREPSFALMDVGFKGLINTATLAVHYLKKQPTDGSLVVCSSITGLHPCPEADYSVAKHGIFGLARSLDWNLTRRADTATVRANAVAPSWTTTSMIPSELLLALGANMQAPAAVARSVALLMADAGRHGETVVSHGGRYWEVGKKLTEALGAICPPLPTAEGFGVFDRVGDWVKMEAERAQKEQA